ncbi:MAG: hypothetical protein Q9174_005912, partial [Haloplaca sp. 1 TL-2023]
MTLVLAARLPGEDGSRIAHDLLKHGASSAQADVERTSALHYLVAKKRTDMLKACLSDDKAAAKSALNHILVEITYHNQGAETPLTTAIKSGDAGLVECLLNVGAKPTIELDDYAPAYEAAKTQRNRYYLTDESVTKIWKERVVQPVMLAVENDIPEMVIQLVDKGADINTLDTHAQGHIANLDGQRSPHHRGKTLFEAVGSKIKTLETAISRKLELPEPVKLKSDEHYLEDQHGPYARWYISKDIESAKAVLQDWDASRSKQLKEEGDRPGQEQRLAALKALQKRYFDLQDELRKRNAKTLAQLHPEVSRRKRDDDTPEETTARDKKSFDPQVTFQVSASDEVLGGYLCLFEAAWEGKIDKIKELTLANWGPEGKIKPLQVSTRDSKGFAPFAIALYRRHYEVARLLVQIADAQYKPEDKSEARRRYVMADEYSDNDSEDDDSDVLNITSEVVDETYTYENVAALQESVGSRNAAAGMIESFGEIWWFLDQPERKAMTAVGQGHPNNQGNVPEARNTGVRSFGNPFGPAGVGSAQDIFRVYLERKNNSWLSVGRYAMVSGDKRLWRFWLQCCQETLRMRNKFEPANGKGCRSMDWTFALKHGLVEEMAEAIKICGAELPLDSLIQSSGVEKMEKPKYYQGLSIGGKKMTAWAKEQGGARGSRSLNECSPPLLQAANEGNLAAVEWFLSDTPLRLYREYCEKHKDDERLKKLAAAPGGFEKAIGSWLKLRNNLALHCAILSTEESSLEVIKYLIAVLPDSIDAPSDKKLTPLALAFLKGRVSAAKLLIDAGADQTTRDNSGKNLIHFALIAASKTNPTDMNLFKSLLNLIDKRVIRSLMTERCKDAPGGLTPLAYWLVKPSPYYNGRYMYGMHQYRSCLSPEIFDVLISHGGEEAVGMMDSSGQFPLHVAVKQAHVSLVEKLLAHDPALLNRENAMGQTPLELAHTTYLQDCAKGNPDVRRSDYTALESREPEDFVPGADQTRGARVKRSNFYGARDWEERESWD